jgi:hypothetical protein
MTKILKLRMAIIDVLRTYLSDDIPAAVVDDLVKVFVNL